MNIYSYEHLSEWISQKLILKKKKGRQRYKNDCVAEESVIVRNGESNEGAR